MITIVLVMLILLVSIAIYGVMYNLQVLKKRNKILETIKCPVCLVSCPKSGECKTCEKCDTGANLSISCLLYTSPSPRDLSTYRMPSSA